MRYRAEIVEMRKRGESFQKIQKWLLKTHRLKVSVSTIFEYVKKLPELENV
jgi:IS30 family transposase